MAVDSVLVGSVGADGRKALEVAAVSLTTKGMEPLRSPWQMSSRVDLTRLVMSFVAAFALSVVCAVFVGVASGENETHVFAPLTGKEERFRRTWGWI
jgi:hypothetical protein